MVASGLIKPTSSFIGKVYSTYNVCMNGFPLSHEQ